VNIGVLALQGDFEAHSKTLARLGAAVFEVRSRADFQRADALVMPGGESTTMLRILDEEGLAESLAAFGSSEKPILATCAGVILLAHKTMAPEQRSFDLLDIDVQRNGYGRQLDSAIKRIAPEPGAADKLGAEPLECVFIRAPIIRRVGSGVETLMRDGELPILVEQGPILGATFHPELTEDSRIHSLFLDKVKASLP
jgi:5'-phosphate synthase pdxT subunit